MPVYLERLDHPLRLSPGEPGMLGRVKWQVIFTYSPAWADETPLMRATWLLLPLAIDEQPPPSSCSARSGRVAWPPWMKPGNPRAYGAPVVAVLGPEFAGQGGFLIEADGGCANTPGHCGVLQEAWRAEQQHLACQNGQEA